MKEEISKKLNVDERSVKLILLDEELCKRILKENPIRINEFILKYGLKSGFVHNLAKRRIISSFRNSHKQGSPQFIFEEEALRYAKVDYNSNSMYHSIEIITFLFVHACKDILSEREKECILTYFNRPSSNLDEWHLTRERVRQIRIGAVKKLARYSDRIKKVDEILTLECRLKELNDCKKSVERKSNKNLINSIQDKNKKIDIRDLDLSVRAFNCLKAANINTVGEIIEVGYEKLKRIRNMGNRSLKEISETLEELGFTPLY
jgi:hypothetical protein